MKRQKKVPLKVKENIEQKIVIEIDDDRSKAFDLDNLIYLSERSHAEIHIEYAKGEKEKKLMQNKLQAYVERYVG